MKRPFPVIVYMRSYGSMRRYTAALPEGGVLDIPEGSSAASALTLLGIPKGLPLVFFVNGRKKAPEEALEPGDTIIFFSPMEGG